MTRAIAAVGFIVLISEAALCQSPASRPAFDIADVHLSPRADWAKTMDNWMQGPTLAGDRYQLRRATMLDLIRTAYSVDADKVFGGPNWIDYDRFEIVAKTKPGTRPATLRLMLQTLLADRFHLVVKTEMQPVPGYVLSKGKGNLKFSGAADSTTSGCQNTPSLDAGVMYNNLKCRNITMDEFAVFLRGFVSRLPVMDSTGFDGGWDIDLQYTTRNLAVVGTPDAAVIDEVEKLGLKLEPGKVPQPVLTVVSADERPSPNPPGVTNALPPLPSPEFEVASIRPCNGQCNMSSVPRFQPGGRVVSEGMSPSFLIMRAWKQPSFEIPGMPKLFTSGRSTNISIVAKAPAGVSPDQDNLDAMLRALLMDRYKMAVHYEDRSMDTYTLVAAKPKLTKADPAGRTGCTRQNEIYPGQGAVIHLDCRNMTITQFAEQIPAYKIDVHYPVLDSTGIDGAWDFKIDYDTFSDFPGRGRGPAASADSPVGEASDPSGSVPFADAIQKQLGLKLEVHKSPQKVLVIDHMEENPTEN
jgi:uncharacterized protein (TIGR03435 family)